MTLTRYLRALGAELTYYDVTLDNILFTAMPEPSTMLM